jgi:glyoxylase-like metal-dependent hydrolase (beta-lactamase superfamily II)
MMPSRSFFKIPLRQRPFNAGEIAAMIVSDGEIECGSVASEFPTIPEVEVNRLLDPLSLARPQTLQENCLLLKLGGRTFLFDAGMGASTLLGPRAGRLPQSLAAAGISVAEIDAVVLTHLHCDHAWGLIDARSAPTFPNAEIFLSKVEFDAWMSEGAQSARAAEDVETMRACLAPYRDRLSFVADGKALMEGVIPISTPGHTSGHMSYLIGAVGPRLLDIGDVCHHGAVQFAQPNWRFRWDDDPDLAARSRLRVLGMAADEELDVVGFHLPFPGVGRVERQADGFRFKPIEATSP